MNKPPLRRELKTPIGRLAFFSAFSFLFIFFVSTKLNDFLPPSMLRHIVEIKWAAAGTAALVTVTGFVLKSRTPNLNIEYFGIVAAVFAMFAAFADIPKKPSDGEIDRLKMRLSEAKKQNESLSLSLQIVALNLSKSTKDEFELAIAEIGLGHYEKALGFLQKATAEMQANLDRQAEIFFYKGVASYHLGGRIKVNPTKYGGAELTTRPYEDVLTSFAKAIDIKPNYHEAWFNMGYVFRELEMHEEALNAYKKAYAIRPDIYQWVDSLDRAHGGHGDEIRIYLVIIEK